MSSEREKRARLSHACDRCRKRHVKCDGDYPICGNCKSVNGECSYSHPGSKRGYVETIDDRLSKIEQVLSRYLEGADSQQHGSHDVEREAAVPEVALTTTHDLVNLSSKKADTSTLADSLSSLTIKSTCYFTLKTEHSDTTEQGAAGKDPKKAPPSLEPPLPPYSEIRGPKDMPPKDLHEHLITLFMTHGYSLRMPIIHKQTFQKQIKEKNNLLLQNGVFALASLFSDDPRVRSDPERPETAGDIFFQRARDLFDDYMDKPRLSTLQAIHLLTQFCVKASQHSFRIWMLIGVQVRMSIDLGLHRDCYKWNLGKVEKALRNRLFWASYVAEVVSCASYGKPLPIYDFDTRLPYEIDEDGEDAQEVVNFAHLCKLFKILANIVQSKPYFTQPSYLRNTLPAIEASLSSWQLALPANLQYTAPPTNDPNPIHVQPYTAFLHQMYNLVLIQLHRPYVDSNAYPHINSREVCTSAAVNITKLTNCIPVDNRPLYYTFNCVAWCLAHAGMIHAMNVSDPELSTLGEHYMRKTLSWLCEYARASGPSMEGVCGVADVRNMLESLFKVQKDKLQENRAARAAERGDDGSSRRGGNGSSGGKYFSEEVKPFPTPPPSTTQENIDIDQSLSPTIVKAEKSPEMSDAKVSSILTGEKTRTSTSSPALRQAAAAAATPGSASSLTPRKTRSLEQTRGQDHLRPRPPFTGMSSTRLYKTNPTPEPSPQFPQQHLQYQQQQQQQQHHHHHHQQQQHHHHQHQPHQPHQPHQQHQVHLSDGGLDGQFMSPMMLSNVSLADPPIVPSSFNATNGYPHGVEYGAVSGQGTGNPVYLVGDDWPMEVAPNPPPSAGQNRSAPSSNSPSSPAVAAGNTATASGQDQNAAFRLQDTMATNYVPFSIASDTHPALLVGDAANSMLDGGGDAHTATPRGGGVSRGNASNRSSQGSDGSVNAAQQVSQQQLLGHLHHHQVPVVSQMPVEQLHTVNGQSMWGQWN